MQRFTKLMLTGLQKIRYKMYAIRFELRRKTVADVFKLRVKSNQELQTIDNIPFTYSMIYRISYQNYLRMLQIGSLIGFSIFLSYIVRHYRWNRPRHKKRVLTATGGPFGFYTDLEYDCFIAGGLLWLLIQWRFSMRHPLRIYRDPATGQYVALFYSSVPFRTKWLRFERHVVRQMPDRFLDWDPFKARKFILNESKRFYLFEHSFVKPIDYNVLVHHQNYSRIGS